MTPELDARVLGDASPWGLPVTVVGETGSTNDDLLRLGEEGAPEGTVLFALAQGAGRGRRRADWASARGLGLWFSLLLRLPVDDRSVPLLSAFAAVALVRTLRALGAPCGIKAPNDILSGEGKMAGILVETRVGRDPFAVVGVGLNVNHAPGDFPAGLRAVSLAMVTGRRHGLTRVAAELLGQLGLSRRLTGGGELLRLWTSLLLPPP